MFKKFTALLLLTTFTNVYAISPIDAKLNKSFNSFNYALNVEWDQQDKNFFHQTVVNFENELASLQKEGLTKHELMNFTVEMIKDDAIKKEIQELSNIINESQMTEEEARAFTISKLNRTYSQGASWSGSRLGIHTAMIIGAIIVITIVAHKDHEKDDTPVIVEDPKDDCLYHHYANYDFSEFNSNCYYPTYL